MRGLLALLALLLLGCDDGQSLGQPPVARIQAPTHCDLGAVVTLDARGSADPDGDIILFRFIIADGSPAKEVVAPTVDHVCRVEGLIGVGLEVEDAKGNIGRAQTTIAVRPP